MVGISKDTELLLALGAIAIVGYSAYKLAKPVSETVGGIGQAATSLTQGTSKGLTSAVVPTGMAIGQIATASGNLVTDVLNAPKNYWNFVIGIGEQAGATFRRWLS